MGNINNPFVAKNGLKIVDSITTSGITYTTLDNNDNILPTSGLIYRELTGKTDFNIFSAHTGNTSIHHTLQSLDNRYVNVSGDTINGNLNIIGNLSATTISATTFYGSNSITTTVKTNLATFDLPYDNANTLTLSKNNNTTLKTTINTVTGLTINNGELKIINDNTNSLYTTKKTVINSGTTLLYSIEYSAYTSVHIDYSLYGNSSARAGFFTSVWYDNNIKYTEFSTSDIGTTSNVTLYSIISGSSINILANSTTNNWNIKTIIKTI